MIAGWMRITQTTHPLLMFETRMKGSAIFLCGPNENLVASNVTYADQQLYWINGTFFVSNHLGYDAMVWFKLDRFLLLLFVAQRFSRCQCSLKMSYFCTEPFSCLLWFVQVIKWSWIIDDGPTISAGDYWKSCSRRHTNSTSINRTNTPFTHTHTYVTWSFPFENSK